MNPRRPTTSTVPSARRKTRADPGVDSAAHHRLSNQIFRAVSPAGRSRAKGAPGIRRTSYTFPAVYGRRTVSLTTTFWPLDSTVFAKAPPSPRPTTVKTVPNKQKNLKLRNIIRSPFPTKSVLLRRSSKLTQRRSVKVTHAWITDRSAGLDQGLESETGAPAVKPQGQEGRGTKTAFTSREPTW